MHIEPLTAASTTPPPFTFEEEPLKHPAAFVLAAPRPALRPVYARRLDWAAIGATAFVYGTAFMTWTLLAR